MVWIVSREKDMIPFSTFCEPVIRLPSMRGGLVVRGWTPDVGCPAPFCFSGGCGAAGFVDLFFNCVFVSCFSRVRARVVASRMGLPPHVLYHGLFVCF